MRQLPLLLCLAIGLGGCNGNDQASAAKTPDTPIAAATDTKMDYAYTVEHPDQWEWGKKEYTKMALASLKAWENGDMTNAVKDFADTVTLSFDAWEKTLPRDSARMVLETQRNMSSAVTILMDDFESVRSKDGKAEYVSLWYKQKWQDHVGKWDSLSVMDDIRIKNGKIAGIDEKTRHYQKK